MLFPVPGAEQDKSLRLAAFVDAGQVYGRRRENVAQRAALLGRHRAVLDLAVRPAALSLAQAAERQERGRSRAKVTIHLWHRLLNRHLIHAHRLTSTLLAARAAAPAALAAAHAEGKIGFVNTERIMRDSAPAVRAQKKIEAEFSKRDQELAQARRPAQAHAGRAGEERRDDGRKPSAAPRSASSANSNRDFQRKQREFREDLNQRRNEELAQVVEQANRIIRQIAEQEKYDIIFQEAVYANPRIDITDKVIKALDGKPPAR